MKKKDSFALLGLCLTLLSAWQRRARTALPPCPPAERRCLRRAFRRCSGCAQSQSSEAPLSRGALSSSHSSTTQPTSLCQSLPNSWLYVKREVERAASDLCADNRMISEARLRFSLCSQAKDYISPRLRVQISDSQLYGEAFNSPECTVLFLYVSLR